MVDPVGVRVEANRYALIVDAEQLIHRSPVRVRIRIGGEATERLDETEVVPVRIDPETGRGTDVVDGRDLGLHRIREVLIGVVPLAIGRGEGVALVGVAGEAAPEVAGDHAAVVDAEQLVEGWVGLVVEGPERKRRPRPRSCSI